MSDYKWESPNSKIVDYGGPILGGITLWLCILYYPVWVIAIQFGLDSEESVMQGALAGIITLVAIWLLQWGCRNENPTCALLLISLFVICLGPAIQYLMWIWGDYSDSGYEATFPGFNWFWFVPSADLWDGFGGFVWEQLKTMGLVAVVLSGIGLIVNLIKKTGK